jgi:AAA family ATP:ADP antiporter
VSPPANFFERLLSRVVVLRPGEGRVAALLFLNIFTLLFAYYLIKPVREMLILTEQNAEVRAYSIAGQALALMFVIPAYTAVLRRVFPHYRLVPWVMGFLALNLLAFVAAGKSGLAIGVPFFIWIGIFNVLILAQFWAFAADLFNVESGERLFVLVAIGAALGAWVGAVASQQLLKVMDPYSAMLVTTVLLLATLPLSAQARAVVPEAARAPPHLSAPRPEEIRGLLAGFEIVLKDSYLRTIALFVMLLNCINTTGEYLLASIVKAHADGLAASGAIADAGQWIGVFYGNYFTWVNGAGVAVQVLLVGRIFRRFGVSGAVLVLPAIAALGYGLLIFLPVFSLVRMVKITENSVNYSLQNTARHALMLPTDEEMKYAGKTTIDTFFWRLGDVFQAAIVWLGHDRLGASPGQFALMNFVLALAWLAVALKLGGMYRGRVKEEAGLSAER